MRDPRPERIDPTQRRVVLHPRTAAARQVGRRSATGRRTRGFLVDDAELAALIDSQRRLALRTGAVLALIVFGLPTALAVFPSFSTLRIPGLPPLIWLVAGIGLYLTLAVLGWFHERAANGVERAWVSERADP